MTATVILPGGYVDDQGRLHREAELVPLSGRDEEQLAGCDPSMPGRFITALLTCCVRRLGAISPVPREVVRRLLIADRLYLALKLRENMCGGRVQATVDCPWKECSQKVDIDFWLDGIPVRESVDKGRLFTRTLSAEACDDELNEGREVTFRLPNGDDQEAIARAADDREGDVVDLLLTRCVQRLGSGPTDGSDLLQRLSPLGRAEITGYMEAVAPSVDVTLGACCPECGREFAVPFDIHRVLLDDCRTSRERLYREVHKLAYHYHWSEGEIMALPREKRRTYLALLSNELRSVSHAV